MPQFRYGTFLLIYATSNSVVWFFLLFGLGHLVYEHFSQATGLSRQGAWAFFALTPLVSSVLASQGAIVNLRAQYLIGRFTSPSRSWGPQPLPSNPWLVSLRTAVPLALVAGLSTSLVMLLLSRDSFGLEATACTMGAIGAAVTFLLALTVSDREFRRFQYHLGNGGHSAVSLAGYIGQRLALPWGLVNGTLNGIFAWIVYHQGPGHSVSMVSVAELRHDLAATTFLICVFSALEIFPEVESDFASGTTPPVSELPPMPPLWRRYALVLGLTAIAWLAVTIIGKATAVFPLSLSWTIGVKTVWGAALAVLATAQCARWSLARCHARVSAAASSRRRRAIA